MEKLTINIPEGKSSLVKQILAGLGVTIQPESKDNAADFKKRLTMVSTWTEDDLKVFEDSKLAFESLKPEKW